MPALQFEQVQLRQWRHGLTSLKSLPPVGDDVEQRGHIQSGVLGRILRQIARCPRQKRLAPDQVPARMVMKRDRDLDQPLKELALGFRRSPPDVLKNFVGLEEFRGIEEVNAAVQCLGMHADSVAHRLLLRGGGSTHQLFNLGKLLLSVGHLGWI